MSDAEGQIQRVGVMVVVTRIGVVRRFVIMRSTKQPIQQITEMTMRRVPMI